MEPRCYKHLNIIKDLFSFHPVPSLSGATHREGNQTNISRRPAFLPVGYGISTTQSTRQREESLGQLVSLGFGVAAFTPATYQRHRL